MNAKPRTRSITRIKDRACFVVTFDEFGEVDTITRDGKPVSAAHRDAKRILNEADDLYHGFAPAGFLFNQDSRS